ncbi:MAG: hypothetical protein M3Q60_07595, partial [Actinomycetota bacterium]|nr:hypothetical protein [Actinomycetota bacterium]
SRSGSLVLGARPCPMAFLHALSAAAMEGKGILLTIRVPRASPAAAGAGGAPAAVSRARASPAGGKGRPR